MKNLDYNTIKSFGDEWTKFNQKNIDEIELKKIFNSYFKIFPWHKIKKNSEGFDAGSGSGRWAKFVAPRVKVLNCIEPSKAINVAKKNLINLKNIKYYKSTIKDLKIKSESQDFGYILGVLHHITDTESALKSCVKILKKGSPLLIYIYYNFENRPFWFKLLWQISNIFRKLIFRLPRKIKFFICDIIAVLVYYPLSKTALILEKIHFPVKNFPLRAYRDKSFYTMRTDARDRFGTPIEKRFSKKQVKDLMKKCGLEKIRFKSGNPYWLSIGYKK